MQNKSRPCGGPGQRRRGRGRGPPRPPAGWPAEAVWQTPAARAAAPHRRTAAPARRCAPMPGERGWRPRAAPRGRRRFAPDGWGWGR
eukprot:scaffold15542_cov112-Isochrysis_galbana.AAC.1